MAAREVPALPLTHLGSGKVREQYELDNEHLLFVTTDRISAFDVVLDQPVPDKGRVLNAMTAFWFDQVTEIVPNQSVQPEGLDLPDELQDQYYAGRTVVARRAEMFPLECIVRGRLTGSAWKEYQQRGTVHGMAVATGMQESEEFPEPIYTPSTKAEIGQHDENISFDASVALVGGVKAELLRDVSLRVFDVLYQRAAEKGIVLADTKLEFGMLPSGLVILCDEVGTPDSSRFWPAGEVVVGTTPPSYDKQYVRDYLTATGWDKKTLPPPTLTDEVVAKTAEKYKQAYESVTGLKLADWPGAIAQ